MKNTLKIFKKGDRVRFLGTVMPILTPNGFDMHAALEVRGIYTVKDSFIVALQLEEIDGVYLKEHFRKIKDE